MSTLVTKAGSVAENLDIGIVGASDWVNLSQALTSDDLRASNDFNHGTGIGKSNYLYISGFDLNLPTDADVVLEGIEVRVERRGTGITEDYYVGLVYNNGTLQITTPGHQQGTTWPATDTLTQYGGGTELWDRIWTPAELNHADFGFAIAIEGNPANLDSGSVDYVEITVYYHRETFWTPTGSGKCGGTAKVNFFDQIDGTGGAVVSGHGAQPFTESTSGGTVCGGAANHQHGIPTFGGAVCGGEASHGRTYSNASSGGAVLGGSSIWNTWITRDASGGAKCGGSADVLTHFPMNGGIRVPLMGLSEQFAIITFNFDSILTGKAIMAGIAVVDPEVGYGTVRCGGTADVGKIYPNIDARDGAKVGGTAPNQIDYLVLGGVRAGGDALAYRLHEIPEWSERMLGSNMVPPVSSFDFSGSLLDVWYNRTTKQLSYRFQYGLLSGLGLELRFYGPAFNGENGPLIRAIPIPFIFPIMGSMTLTSAEETILLTGKMYAVVTSEGYPEGEQRCQLWHHGAMAGGDAIVVPYFDVGHGGITAGGSAAVFPWIADGAALMAGSANVTSVYNFQRFPPPNTYEFRCTGAANVPPDTDHNLVARAKIRVNLAGTRVYWDITHNAVGLEAVRLRGPANRSSTAQTQIQIDLLQSTTSPIVGNALITSTQRDDIAAGLWYLFLRDDDLVNSFRGQVENNIGMAGGLALTSFNDIVSIGGIGVGGGAATVKVIYPISVDSVGGMVGGRGIIASHYIGTGGAIAGGAANVSLVPALPTVGGVICNGSAIFGTIINSTMSGGGKVNGSAVRSDFEIMSGGSKAGGDGISLHLVIPPISGGAVISPSHILQQTYAASGINIVGGVRASGRARVEKFKFFIHISGGYGAAMDGTNILIPIFVNPNKLIDPIGTESPELEEDRFKFEQEGAWCDVEEKCEEGVLPKIIQTRQKGFVPPKIRAVPPKDRRLAVTN